MIGRIANLYAEKALNDNLLACGMITPEMHRKANESIILDIDSFSKMAHTYDNKARDRSMADGFAERPTAAG